MALANTAALRMAKVTADTKEPAGGVIFRLDDGKTPSGILKDNAMALVERLIPEPGPDEIADAVRAAMRACAENGITGVQDMDGSSGETRRTLLDIVGTVISPELLPVGEGAKPQSTEAAIGPYELVDFFLYHFLRWGAPPEKILFLASQAKFDRPYAAAEVRKWLTVFLRRFFANQFKRSCLPDGPKVGSVSVSPRGDWRMPSDANARVWLDEVEAASE